MFIDRYYIFLVLPAIIFSMYAQGKVNSTFNRFSQVRTRRGVTGADAARAVLAANGVTGVEISHVSGSLTDHYDPSANVIRLSDTVYSADTVAAVGVAAHEAGHAVQYATGYAPIKIRAGINVVSQLGSKLLLPMVLVGIFFNAFNLVTIGCIMFFLTSLLQIATLPVEFNASARAVDALAETGILGEDELPGAQKTLSAAAMTYVAAMLVALAQFARFAMLANRRSRR